MNNNFPLVSIVIPTYNRKKMAERLINSILRNTYKNIEIIVIDDASLDGTSEYLNAKFGKNKKIKIFKNKKNLFAAGSKNVGQKKTKGELIMFIDDDNTVEHEMIGKLVNVFKTDPGIGEAGPVNYNFNDKNLVLLSRSTRNMWTTKTHHLRSLTPFKSMKQWETDDIPNAFMVRAGVIKKNKIEFRAKFGIMYEESDYAYRIRKAGYKIAIIRNAKIYHDIEDNSLKDKRKDYMYHFMEDKRRPFVFARNRVIFHSLYSSKIQKVFIFSFWIWFFSAYYVYKFLFYNGYGDFSIFSKLKAAISYLEGTIIGLRFIFDKDYDI